VVCLAGRAGVIERSGDCLPHGLEKTERAAGLGALLGLADEEQLLQRETV